MSNVQNVISVLIPTRWRGEMCRRTVQSCIDKADDPSVLEFGFLIDAGDPETRDGLLWRDEIGINYYLIEQTWLRGYRDLHLKMNLLAACGHGDWLWVLSDDFIVMSKGWDSMVLSEGDGRSVYKILQMHMNWEPDCAPIVSRAVFNCLGHLSPHLSIDGYLTQLGNLTGIRKVLDFRVYHDRAEEGKPKDRTRHQRDGELEKWHEEEDWEIHNSIWQGYLMRDAEKIENVLT